MAMHSDADYLQAYKGNWRVRIKVPVECRDNMPEAFKGKIEILRTTGISVAVNRAKARQHTRRMIADYLDMIEAARPVPTNTNIGVWNAMASPLAYMPGYGQRFAITGQPMPQTYFVNGHWAPQATQSIIDVSPDPIPVAKGKVSFDDIIVRWGIERQHEHVRENGAIVRRDSTRDNFEMVFRHFAAFVGHDDANAVTDTNVADYKAELLVTKKSQDTVKKYLTMLGTVFSLAKTNKQIDANPCEEIKFVPAKNARNSRQDGFTTTEMAKMVSAARQSDKAVIRIPVLIAAYSGACLGEIVEAHKRDFEESESGLVFHIRLDNRSDGQELKTEFRPRRFPLHSSIVPEVKAYLDTLPDGPLFPDIAKDRFGKIAHNAGEHLRKWIKGLGIVRKGIGFHAFPS